MANIYDPNPHISILDDGQLKKQIATLAERALDQVDRLKTAPPLSEEQMERERFQFESNALAEEAPLYAAARAVSANFLVVPLEPGSTKPLVDVKKAVRDDHQLFEWWMTWPDANPGVLLGRVGGIFALQVNDMAAHLRLREMVGVRHPEFEDGRDSVKSYVEYRELGGYFVRLQAPSERFAIRTLSGWGREYTRKVIERDKEQRAKQPETFWLVFSYPDVVTGMDAFEYRSRTIATGVKLVGEGEVLPWAGSVLEGGVTVVAPMSKPPEVPLWLAKTIGKPRSRKAMNAAREQYEADLRVSNARAIAAEAQLRILEDEARAKAEEDRAKAEKVLADEMAKG